MVKKKNVKEFFVTFGVRRNGRYYAKEELSLEDFKNFLVDIENNLGFEQPDYNWFDRLLGKQKVFEKEIKIIRFYRIHMLESIIADIRYIMDYDGPGKKVMKK